MHAASASVVVVVGEVFGGVVAVAVVPHCSVGTVRTSRDSPIGMFGT